MPQQLLLKQLAFYGAYHTNFWNQVPPTTACEGAGGSGGSSDNPIWQA
jgi:hypothetical protein